MDKKKKKKQNQRGRKLSDELKREEAKAIFESPAIPLEMAKKIERQHEAKPSERRAARRAKLVDTFGVDSFTVEVVEESIGNKRLDRQIKRIVMVAAMMKHFDLVRNYLLEKDLQTACSGFDAQLSSEAMLYQLIGSLVRKADETLMPGLEPVVKGFFPYSDKTESGDPHPEILPLFGRLYGDQSGVVRATVHERASACHESQKEHEKQTDKQV